MYDVIIIGAGVVGCATAYQLSRYKLNVLLLESENDVSDGTSKANSAIIHAGFDAEEGTLMAYHNVRGSKLTKEICEKLDVPYQQCGALVIGFNDEDLVTINNLYQRGLTNGVEQLEVLNQEEVLALEPQLNKEVKGALLAKTSAIVSPWELTLALAETAIRNGVDLKLRNKVIAISKENDIFTVTTNQASYQSKYIVNAAGCNGDKVFELIGEKEFTISYSRGQYYLLDKSEGTRCSHTIFQCPNEFGKGVLVSPTVHGNLIVGPNAEDNGENSTDTTSSGLAFVKETAAKSIPSINFNENIRNFAGVRAKSDRHDFIVEESKSVNNFFNIVGIKSPGLSAAVSLGLAVVDWLKGKGEALIEKEAFIDSRKRIRFKNLSIEEKQQLIKENPSYGRVICRCETITEGEILACFDTPIPPVSIDGIKRRCNPGMGRCQGGFCGEKVAHILADKIGVSPLEVLQDKDGSNILVEAAKGQE